MVMWQSGKPDAAVGNYTIKASDMANHSRLGIAARPKLRVILNGFFLAT